MNWLRIANPLRSHHGQGWLYLLPLMITTIVIIVVPTIATVAFSLTEWSGFGEATYIGLENFQRMLSDLSFLQALGHAVIWTAIFLTVPVFMGLLGAVLLKEVGSRLQTVFKLVYFIPVTLASVVNAHIWRSLYDPFRGAGAQLAELGFPFLKNVAFLGEKHLALYAVAWVDVWRWWGFLVVIFLAAMQSINPELYDAAKVDGGSTWQEFRHVTLPGIRVTFLFVILITIVGSLNVFDYVYILTQGGPAGATEVPVTLLYKSAFQRFEAGYAAAIGTAMSFLSGLVLLGYLMIQRLGWEE